VGFPSAEFVCNLRADSKRRRNGRFSPALPENRQCLDAATSSGRKTRGTWLALMSGS